MLQTYADESGWKLVMRWETDLTERSAHSRGISRSLGLAVRWRILCLRVCMYACAERKVTERN